MKRISHEVFEDEKTGIRILAGAWNYRYARKEDFPKNNVPPEIQEGSRIKPNPEWSNAEFVALLVFNQKENTGYAVLCRRRDFFDENDRFEANKVELIGEENGTFWVAPEKRAGIR